MSRIGGVIIQRSTKTKHYTFKWKPHKYKKKKQHIKIMNPVTPTKPQLTATYAITRFGSSIIWPTGQYMVSKMTWNDKIEWWIISNFVYKVIFEKWKGKQNLITWGPEPRWSGCTLNTFNQLRSISWPRVHTQSTTEDLTV